MLVGLAFAALAGAAIVTIVGQGGWTVLLITYLGGGALGVVMLLRLRQGHYSVAGVGWFIFTLLAFTVWNFLCVGVSVWTRWTGLGRWTFGLVEVVSAVPLIVSVGLLHRRLTATSAGSRGESGPRY
jgi:hypothetical protein